MEKTIIIPKSVHNRMLTNHSELDPIISAPDEPDPVAIALHEARMAKLEVCDCCHEEIMSCDIPQTDNFGRNFCTPCFDANFPTSKIFAAWNALVAAQ